MSKFTCPRRAENGMNDENSPFRYAGSNLDEWQKNGTCSYCGSVKPEMLFEAIDNGWPLGSTDKNYKVYVDLPGSGKLVEKGWSNTPKTGNGWKKRLFKKEWVFMAPDTTRHAKFYFQHFSKDEQRRFFEALNSGNIVWQGGFGLSRLPFFIKKEKEPHAY